MQGHTARKLCSCSFCEHQSAPTLERTAQARHFHFRYSLCDQDEQHASEQEYGALRPSTLAEPFKITDFELDGLDVIHSLDRDSAWSAVPNILAEHSVSVPEVRKLSSGRVMTTFQLAPAGMLMPDPMVAEELHRFTHNIYEIRRHRPTLVRTIPTEPPEEVPLQQPLLRATLSCTGMRVPQTATVRCNQNASYWNVEGANGKPLEIDLGTTCLISHVATQGRHPPLRPWPKVWRDSSTGLWAVEDAEYQSSHVPGTRYKGPFYQVRMEASFRDEGGRHLGLGYHEPMYVRRYELFWRADGGRRWHPLGAFEGNSDETSEVAHSFAAVRGGLRARYLRVVPLETEGGGGLRVGVYGEPAGAAERHVQQGANLAASRAGAPRDAVGEDVHALVEYRLTTGGPRGFARDGKGLRRGYDAYFDSRKSGRRCSAKLWAAREADAYRREERLLGYDSDGYGDGEPSAHRRLASLMTTDDDAALTAEEREELELALALSASLEQQRQHAGTPGTDAGGAGVYESTSTLSDAGGATSGQEGVEDGDSESWCSARLSAESSEEEGELVEVE